jgi:pilus assembly protein TadC
MNVLVIINFIIIAILTVILAYNIVAGISFKAVLIKNIDRLNKEYKERRLQREVRKYTRTINIKLSWFEKMEIYFIDKSNIRQFIPFMNIYVLIGIYLISFIVLFRPVYKVLFFIPSAAVVSGIIALIPFVVLDIMGRWNSENIRKKLSDFISSLNGWCDIKEDIIYAFSKTAGFDEITRRYLTKDATVQEPLRSYIRDMCIQIEKGIDPMEALDILQLRVDNEQFKDFIINIKQNIKSRGNTKILLSNLELQFDKMEKEYTRRNISTLKDRIPVYIMMFVVLIVAYVFIKLDIKVENYYLGSLGGKILLTLFSVMYAVGVYLTFRITKFDY